MARENREMGDGKREQRQGRWQERTQKVEMAGGNIEGEMAGDNREMGDGKRKKRRWREIAQKVEMVGDSRESGDGKKEEKPKKGEKAMERQTADFVERDRSLERSKTKNKVTREVEQ